MIRDRWAAGLILAAVLGVALAVACRDDVAPFDPDERELDPDAPVVRLTSSAGDDRAPAWSVGGDSVYYTAEGFDHLPPEPGVLVGLPRFGGVARPILRNVQTGTDLGIERWLVAPTPNPDGERIAFVDIGTPWPANPCPGTTLSCDPMRDTVPLPPLRDLVLRVRAFDAVGPLSTDPQLSVPIPGVTIDSGVGFVVVPRYNVRFLPHQRLFESERSFTFRPSWNPRGDRLVFSDGTRLLVWTVDEGEPLEIEGTEGALSPAWSPSDEWIAFSRRVVSDSTHTSCSYVAGLGICAFVEYTEFDLPRPVLTLIRPDGSEVRELFTGADPAWAPDGTLYFSGGGQIWRVVPPDGEPTPVPGTEGGIEPAISPDGARLAFARLSSRGDHDIWVIELAP